MIRLIKLTLFILLFANISFGQTLEIKGKIIDRNFKPIFAVKVENITTKEQVFSDKNGSYIIHANLNDTLKYSFVGLTDEERVIDKEELNIILIDKTLNCLGAIWSDRKWKKEQKKLDKYYKKLYLIANKENHWETNM
jgi:hypothetical protein